MWLQGITSKCPGQNILEQNILGQNVLGQNILAQNVLGQNILGQNVLGQNILAQNVLGENILDQNILGQNILAEIDFCCGLRTYDIFFNCSRHCLSVMILFHPVKAVRPEGKDRNGRE